MKRNSFVFYRSFFEAIEKLKKNDKLTVYSYLCKYALGEEVGELDGVPAAIFDLMKPQIDANIRRYENGIKGGRPITKPKPNSNLTETKAERNDNVNDNDNDNDNVNANDNANSNPNWDADGGQSGQSVNTPTYEDVVKECREKKYSAAIASKFFMHYDRSGWKTNDGDPVRDWKKMLGIWVNNEKEEKPPNKRGKPSGWKEYQQRGTETNEELEAMLLDMGG